MSQDRKTIEPRHLQIGYQKRGVRIAFAAAVLTFTSQVSQRFGATLHERDRVGNSNSAECQLQQQTIISAIFDDETRFDGPLHNGTLPFPGWLPLIYGRGRTSVRRIRTPTRA